MASIHLANHTIALYGTDAEQHMEGTSGGADVYPGMLVRLITGLGVEPTHYKAHDGVQLWTETIFVMQNIYQGGTIHDLYLAGAPMMLMQGLRGNKFLTKVDDGGGVTVETGAALCASSTNPGWLSVYTGIEGPYPIAVALESLAVDSPTWCGVRLI